MEKPNLVDLRMDAQKAFRDFVYYLLLDANIPGKEAQMLMQGASQHVFGDYWHHQPPVVVRDVLEKIIEAGEYASRLKEQEDANT